MTVTIRPRRPEDIPALAEVLVRVHARDGYPVEGVAQPEQWISPPHELAAWTAEANGVPIGHIALTHAISTDDAAAIWLSQHPGRSPDELAIPARLFVDPEHRRHGAGCLLTEAALRQAVANDLIVVFDVMRKDRDAITLYEALGCRLVGTTEHTHGDGLSEPALIYEAPARRH